MDKNEKQELITALKNGTVQVTFQKVNSDEIRVMPCTLNPSVLEANGQTNKVNYTANEMEAFPVWSLDKNAWRSFRLDTVEGWEVL